MGRPAGVMNKAYCEHGFPYSLCLTCAVQRTCMHGMYSDCLLCSMQNNPDKWFAQAAGSAAKSNLAAASLELGINERYRSAILLASQRTGMDPAAIAAIINAESVPIKDKQTREKAADEVFRAKHPDRDWDKNPLSKKIPGDAPLIKEWTELFANGPWDPRSYNNESRAAGMTQFLESTWESEAKRRGTYLNSVAKERGYLDSAGKVVSSKRAELLELRYDPTLAIVAGAEYDVYEFERLSKARVSDPKAVDQAFFARHPERDFKKQPLGPKDAELIKEWKQFSQQLGKSLIPANLTDDQKARYLYLGHHEGFDGAVQILTGTLNDKRAAYLFEMNVTDQKRRDAMVQEHGSPSKAYTQWLWGYIDTHIQPSAFRKSWSS